MNQKIAAKLNGDSEAFGVSKDIYGGLTKLEYMATIILGHVIKENLQTDLKKAAIHAVSAAQYLLIEIECSKVSDLDLKYFAPSPPSAVLLPALPEINPLPASSDDTPL